jgi:serine/threonine-protein kinase
MSPEQCRGAKSVTTRSDVYSLGVMLYQMLAGRPPFMSDGVGDLLAMHIKDAPPPLRQFADVTPELAHLLHSMLAKSPEDRPPMHAVAKALREMGRAQNPAAPSGVLPLDERATVRGPAGALTAPPPSTGSPPASAQTPGSAVTPVPIESPAERQPVEPPQTERSRSASSPPASAPSGMEPAPVEVPAVRADGLPEAKTQPLLRVALGVEPPPTAPRLDLSQLPTLYPGPMRRESTPPPPRAPRPRSPRSLISDALGRVSPAVRIGMSLALLALLSVAVALSYFLLRAG